VLALSSNKSSKINKKRKQKKTRREEVKPVEMKLLKKEAYSA
jgi:hypothetical protein